MTVPLLLESGQWSVVSIQWSVVGGQANNSITKIENPTRHTYVVRR